MFLQGCLVLACVLSAATPQPLKESVFRQLTAAELRDMELTQSPSLLDVAARTGESVVINMTESSQGGIVQDGVNVLLDCYPWLSKFPRGTVQWYLHRYLDLDHTVLDRRVLQTKENLNAPSGLMRIGGESDRYYNITRVSLIQREAAEDPHHNTQDPHRGVYECEVCLARGTPFEVCHSANVTLAVAGRPPLLNSTTGRTPDSQDRNTEVYRVGATICINIHPTDYIQNRPFTQVELRCPIPVENEERNIPPRIPLHDLTWTHIDRDGNIASFNSMNFGTDDEEFSETFPLLDPLASMNILILNTNPNPPEVQDSLIFRTFNISRNVSDPRYQILLQAYGTWICRVNNSLGDESAATVFTDVCASPPTNISAKFVSPTIISVTWSPPSSGAGVTGYVVHYNRSSGEEESVALGRTAQSYTINITDCVGVVNITIIALSLHLSSEPQTLLVHLPKVARIQVRPVTATAVRVDWSPVGPGWEVTFILREQSYSLARERVIYQNEKVYGWNTSAIVEVNDVYPGYQHIFSVRHSVECEREAISTSFEFDKAFFQIQFGPIQHCLTWEEKKVVKIEAVLHAHVTHIIHERCPSCEAFSESFLRKGVFLCQDSPTMTSYRSTIVSPGLPGSPIATTMVGIIQEWVSESPSLTIDWLLVRVNSTCPAHIPSLAAPECSTTSSHLPNPALLEHINQVINTCTVRQLGQQLCHV